MIRISGANALRFAKANTHKSWNRSASSDEISANPSDASRRIHDCYATIEPKIKQRKFQSDASVFAMGSCFAREIEQALIDVGGKVVSIDRSIQCDEFRDADGKIRSTFFHRYTPRSIWQEFMHAFERLDHWKSDSLLFEIEKNNWTDLNYCRIKGMPQGLDATLRRRKIARDLVRTAKEAKVIVITLGLTEAWFHLPSGMYANYADPQLLVQRREDFELHVLDHNDTMECLDGIRNLLRSIHSEDEFRFVVTVSPVPLQSTFTDDDIIIANSTSKSTLRAAAAEFTSSFSDVDYFPSYEMVMYSDPDLAWRPDRVHVNRSMVDHIVKKFRAEYFQDL